MNKDFKVKRANKGEEMILALLMKYEEFFKLKEGENEVEASHDFYINRIKYEFNINTKKIGCNNLGDEINNLDEESEFIFEIIRNDKEKITFKKKNISKLNGLSSKESIQIIEELEKSVIKELNVTDEFEYILSEPFIEYENKISVVDTITNTDLYKKSKEGIKKFAKSIFNPELKDKAKDLLEQRGIEPQKAVESIKEKLEFSTPKTKLYFAEDGRQYLNHKNEWYINFENEIIYSNYLYDLLTKECYEIRDNEKIPFSQLESELDLSEENLNRAKEHSKNAQIKNTSATKLEFEIKTKRAQIQKIRKKLEFVANNFFVKIKNITNYTEMELINIAKEIEQYLIEVEQKNNDIEVLEGILSRLTDTEKQAFSRVLSRSQK